MSSLDRESLRRTLSAFDERQRKIVGGVIAVMIEHSARVRDREWVAEKFTQVVLLSAESEDASGTEEMMERVREYARENVDAILNACYLLFQYTAEDMESRGEGGFTREEAVLHALSYLAC